MSTSLLTIKNIAVRAGDTDIIKSVTLSMQPGELHVLMGPNGSGKSSLAYSLMGHPHYDVSADELTFDGNNLLELEPDERARLGIFLGFQYPLAISGISLSSILPAALKAHSQFKTVDDSDALYPTLAHKEAAEQRKTQEQMRKETAEHIKTLGMEEEMLYRSINEGFSGGEKKKAEILQMLTLKPKLAILDEPDSGLDVDALKLIAKSIDQAHQNGTAVLLITHYQRIVQYLKPDYVHIMRKGKLEKTGGPELIKQVEEQGYNSI